MGMPIRVMPLVPDTSADQLALVPIPSDDTRPMPLMTTRLLTMPPRDYFFPLPCASM